MVKLMKHELYALFRILVFIAAAVVLFAVLSRVLISINLSGDRATEVQSVLLLLVIMFYIIAICALIFVAWGLGISRFYKTLFTGEGYMTLSLPVSADRLIWSKLLSSLIAMAFATAVSALSLLIFFIGWDAAVMQAIGASFGELFQAIYDSFRAEPLLLTEQLAIGIASIPMMLLLVYALICVGQLFTSRRSAMIFLIVLAAYALYMFFSVLVSAPFANYLHEQVPAYAEHILNCIRLVCVLAIDVGCFFLVRYILRNKVNLIA